MKDGFERYKISETTEINPLPNGKVEAVFSDQDKEIIRKKEDIGDRQDEFLLPLGEKREIASLEKNLVSRLV